MPPSACARRRTRSAARRATSSRTWRGSADSVSRRTRIRPKPELRWNEWDAPFDGIEWFNADSQWRDEKRWQLLPTLLQYPVRPAETVVSLFDRPASLLRRWDELTARRPVVGLAAADAHARMGLGGKTDPYDELVYVKAPSYEAIFESFSLRVELREPLSGDPVRDADDR